MTRVALRVVCLALPAVKSSKSKRPATSSKSHSSSSTSDPASGRVSTSKVNEESRATSGQSSSHRSSSRSKSHQSSTSTSSSKTSTSTDRTLLDPMSLAAANSSLAFPYFLPPLLPQTSSTTSANNHSSSLNYPFSNLSSSLLNPAATLFPFLSPDWFASSSQSIDGFANLAALKPTGNRLRNALLSAKCIVDLSFLSASNESTSVCTVEKVLLIKPIPISPFF